MAAALLALDVSALPGAEAHEVVLACERLVPATHAVQAEAMVAAAGPEPVPDAESGREPVDADAEWLAVELGGSRQFQLSRIDTARYLLAWLPRPNCHQPAVRCDLDHVEAFDDGGPTTCANLCVLCRRHHRLKHETDADYHQEPDGRTIWIDRRGRTYVRPAEQRHNDWSDWFGPADVGVTRPPVPC